MHANENGVGLNLTPRPSSPGEGGLAIAEGFCAADVALDANPAGFAFKNAGEGRRPRGESAQKLPAGVAWSHSDHMQVMGRWSRHWALIISIPTVYSTGPRGPAPAFCSCTAVLPPFRQGSMGQLASFGPTCRLSRCSRLQAVRGRCRLDGLAGLDEGGGVILLCQSLSL